MMVSITNLLGHGGVLLHLGEVVGEVQDVLHQVTAECQVQVKLERICKQNKKQRTNEKRDLRGGNLEVWNGPVVNSQTTLMPKK